MDKPRRRGKGRRSDIPWEEIRAAYASGETNYSELGRRFDCSPDSISRRAKQENWPTKAELLNSVGAKVIDIGTKKAIDRLGGEEKLAESVAASVEDALQRHLGLEARLLDVATSTLDLLKKQLADQKRTGLRQGTHSSEAEEIKQSIEAVVKAIDASRMVRGLRPGQPSTASEGDDEKRIDQVVLVVREHAAKTA